MKIFPSVTLLFLVQLLLGLGTTFANQNSTDHESMVWVPGGMFTMGSDDYYMEESPAHQVHVNGFWMDKHEVTNAQFAQFIEQTHYQTVAERPVSADTFPMASPDLLKPGSAVFVQPKQITSGDIMQWWKYIPGADWRHPTGPSSSINGLGNHPVVHIAFEDALAYAKWAGHELPTEAQWERAASSQRGKKVKANTWQGKFPIQNMLVDGHAATAPVQSYPPNELGLYDMLGNVWEWTTNWYAPRHVSESGVNPTGPDPEHSYAPREPGVKVRVIKGGSYLCASSYCLRYRPSARHAQDTGMGSNHIGFRTVLNAPGPKISSQPINANTKENRDADS